MRSISLILPLYNEEKRLKQNFSKIHNYLKGNFENFEIILVNDGSRDKTPELIKTINKNYKHTFFISTNTNYGKGHAIKLGVGRAQGSYVFFMDIDLSVELPFLKKAFVELKNSKKDIVISSRRLKGSILVKRQPRLREILGYAFSKLAIGLLDLNVVDVTCGCKGFKKVAARQIFSNLKIYGWSFDADVLYIAKKLGFTVLELPVIWKHDSSSKVNLSTDTLKALFDLIRIRFKN